MSSGRVGGLYVAVGANVSDAMKALGELKAEAQSVAQEISSIGGGGGKSSAGDYEALTAAMRESTTAVRALVEALTGLGGAQQKAADDAGKTKAEVDKASSSVKDLAKAAAGGRAASKAAADGLDDVAKSAKKAGDAARVTGKSLPTLNQGMYRLSQSFVNLRYGNPLGVIVGLTQAFSSMSKSLIGTASRAKEGVGSFFQLKNAAKMTGVAALGLVKIVAALTVALTALAAIAGAALFKLGKFGVDAAANLQTLRIQYEGLLGSAEKATAEVKYLQDVASKSVVPTESILEANRALLTYGVTADTTRRQLVGFLADFGSSIGDNGTRINSVAEALGKIQSKGRSTQQNLDQLANAGINVSLVFEKLAEQQGISIEQARKFASTGEITADILIPAILATGEAYKATAEKARNSFQGIMANFKDKITNGFAEGFQPVLEKLTGFLKKVEEFVERLGPMFDGIGAAFSNFFDYISDAFVGLEGNPILDASFWNETLPEALNKTMFAISLMIRYWRTLWEVVMIVVNGVILAVTGMVAGITSGIAAMIDQIANVVGFFDQAWGDALRSAARNVQDFSNSAGEAAEGAGRRIADAARTIGVIWSKTEYKSLVYRIVPDYQDAGVRAANRNAQVPSFTPPTASFGGSGGSSGRGGSGGGGAAKPDPAIQQWKDWLAKVKEIIAAALAGLKTMRDATRRPFKELSSIQKTFRGNSIDGLISQYDSLSEALKKFYGPATSKWLVGAKAARAAKKMLDKDLAQLRRSTAKAINLLRENEKLEKRRARIYERQKAALEEKYAKKIEAASDVLDKATEKYKDANDRLEALIEEREAFIDNIRDNANSFVNAFDLEQETIEEFSRLDGAGSFVSEQRTRTKSFRESLESRLTALRDWIGKVRALQARGLDDNLLQQLINAGPEQSAEVVNQLSGASDDILAEVNDLQNQLRSEIEDFAQFSSATWFDAGIAEQQTITDNAQSAVDAAREVFEGLEAERDAALEALENSYKNYTDRLGQQIKANEKTARQIGERIQKQFKKLGTGAYASGLSVTQGLIDGMTADDKKIVAAAKALAERIASAIRKALKINSPSKLTMYLGEMVGAGLAAGMDDTTDRIEMAARRMAISAVPDINGPAAPEIRVYIGDRELTDIVDVQIGSTLDASNNLVRAGRRV